jgi:hypothetical protein
VTRTFAIVTTNANAMAAELHDLLWRFLVLAVRTNCAHHLVVALEHHPSCATGECPLKSYFSR